MTDWKREESAWVESSATEDCRLPPVRPHLEALLSNDWRRSQSAAEAKPDQDGRALVRREMRRAVQTQNMAPSDRLVSERPEGKQRLSSLAHGSSDLPPHSEIVESYILYFKIVGIQLSREISAGRHSLPTVK